MALVAPSARTTGQWIYAALPFKRAAFLLLRRIWTPPPALTKHLFFKGPFPVDVDGETVSLTNHDSAHETALFWHGVAGWPERASLAYWTILCKRASTIVDGGANIGIYSLVAKAVNPSATVCAFEPVARFFARLTANCERNQLDVRCYAAALSNADGEGVLWDLPADHHYHASLSLGDVADHAGLVERRVVTRRLDSVLAEEAIGPPDLLKVDVEGWEPEVLEGMGRLLANKPTILIEIKSVERAQRIEALVAGLEYHFYDIDEVGVPKRHPHLGPSRKWNWLLCQAGVATDLGLS